MNNQLTKNQSPRLFGREIKTWLIGLFIFVFSFLLLFVTMPLFAWSGPTAYPPGGNVLGPVWLQNLAPSSTSYQSGVFYLQPFQPPIGPIGPIVATSYLQGMLVVGAGYNGTNWTYYPLGVAGQNIIYGASSSSSAAGSNLLKLEYDCASVGCKTALTVGVSGNVGIGTTASDAKLDILPSTAAALRVKPFGIGVGNTGEIRLLELTANGTNFVGFKSPDILAADNIYVLPTAYPAVSGQVLSSTTAGVMSWVTAGGVSWPLLSTINGTAAAPAYSWSADSDMGIRRGGADNLTFVTTGSDRVTIDSAGNVGIGTAGPLANLNVQQTITATGALKGIIYTGVVNTNQTLSTEIPAVTITTAGRQWATGALTTQREVLITQPTYSFVGASTITDAATVGIAGAPIKSTNATITNTHGLLIQTGAVSTATNSYGLTVNTQTGATNNYAAAFLGGNVGIGTTSPGYPLDIQNSGGVGTAEIRLNQNNATKLWTGVALARQSTEKWFVGMDASTDNLLFRRGSSTNDMTIDTNGNVGIGTTSPENAEGWGKVLDVYGASTSKIIATTNAIQTGIWSHNIGFYGALAGGIAGTKTNHPYSLITNGTARLTILASGNVGIGTTTVGSKLQVNGNAAIGYNASTAAPSNGLAVSGNVTVGSSITLNASTGKITATEFDPIYEIDGTKYATYALSTTGLKEEVVGKIKLESGMRDQESGIYSYIIDFNRQGEGSDLWLFRQITAFGQDWKDLVVLLTPEGQAQTWYELSPKENKLIVYGTAPVKISYRFIAPRFDWPSRDTNLSSDQNISGLKVR